MDPQLVQLYRQYMQQTADLTMPPAKLLVQDDIQRQIYRYFFDPGRSHLPPSHRQIPLLKHIIRAIEEAIQDPEEEV